MIIYISESFALRIFLLQFICKKKYMKCDKKGKIERGRRSKAA